jgi:putative transposase
VTRWRPDFNPESLYFITTTAATRAHLFRRDIIKRILVDNLNLLRILDRIELFVFVVMPNHMHFIVRCAADYPISSLLRDFKSNTAKQIVWQYEAEGNQGALDFLRKTVRRPGKQEFKVWDDEYLAKEIATPDFLLQKVEYVHNNPLQPHWNLVERAEDYPWSSARFYLIDGAHALIPVSDVRELLV